MENSNNKATRFVLCYLVWIPMKIPGNGGLATDICVVAPSSSLPG